MVNIPNLIGITGYARHGKGSVAKILKEEYGYEILSFAAPVKEFLLKLNPLIQTSESINEPVLGMIEPPYRSGIRLSVLVAHHGSLDAVKNLYPDVRTLLQRIGNDACKPIFGDTCWSHIGLNKAYKIIDKGGRVCFDDMRFPVEEGEKIIDAYRVYKPQYPIPKATSEIWRVTRFTDDGSLYDNGIGTDHPSEREVKNFEPDEEISNQGTIEDLRTIICGLLNRQPTTVAE